MPFIILITYFLFNVSYLKIYLILRRSFIKVHYREATLYIYIYIYIYIYLYICIYIYIYIYMYIYIVAMVIYLAQKYCLVLKTKELQNK